MISHFGRGFGRGFGHLGLGGFGVGGGGQFALGLREA